MFERSDSVASSADSCESMSDSLQEEEDLMEEEDLIQMQQAPPSPPPLADPRKKGFLVSLKDFWDSVRITLFVLGSATILFIAASNTITWHLQRFWGASGNYWQSQWEKIHGLFGGNDFMMVVVGTSVVANLVFWVMNIFLISLDYYGRPKCLLKYKVQKDKNRPLEREKLSRVVKYVLINQVFVAGPVGVIMFYVYRWRGCDFGPTLPTFHWGLFELLVYSMVEEIGFYYSHRLSHHPFMYRHVHKIHHEWKAPIGVRAIYAHPLEHFMSNLLPAILGPLLMGSHITTTTFWFCLAFFSTTIAHCGYHFPFLPSPEAHDYHHLKFNQNFGVMGILDRFHGTDNLFRQSIQYQRHFFLTSLTPVTDTFPDPKQGTKRGARTRACSEGNED